jgi:tetratricopeptide (TPR) repeat protein
LKNRPETIRVAVLLVACACVSGIVLAEEPAGPATGSDLDEETRRRAEAYYQLMIGVWEAREGRIQAATGALNRALEIEPDSADLRAEVAFLLVSIGRSAEGERQARRALEIDPDNERALRLLAELVRFRSQSGSRGGTGSVYEAVTLYERLTALPGAKPEDHYALTRLKLRIGDLDGAAESARALSDSRLGDPQAVRLLVRVLLTAERQDEALETLLGFLAENPDVTGPDLEETVALTSELTRDREAWQAFLSRADDVLAAHPEVGDLHALHGEALLKTGDAVGASRAFEQALKHSGDEPMLKMHLATIYAGTRRYADAADLARELADEYPDHPRVLMLLGEVLAEQGESVLAIEALIAAGAGLAGDPAEAETRDAVRRRIAGLRLFLEDPDGAGAVLATLENSGSAESLEMLARHALETGDPDEARGYARRLRDLGDRGSAALIEAEVLVLEGRTAKAKARFAEASTSYGGNVWARAAELFRQADQPEIGEELLRDWVAAEPQSADSRFFLGAYLERIDRFDEAENELRQAVRLDPAHAEALNHLGYSLADRNLKLLEAHGFIERALEIDPWNGAYLDSLGWVLHRMGRNEEALDPLERASRELPADATVLDHLGDVYHDLGNGERAVLAWGRAMELDPEMADKIRAKIALYERESN